MHASHGEVAFLSDHDGVGLHGDEMIHIEQVAFRDEDRGTLKPSTNSPAPKPNPSPALACHDDERRTEGPGAKADPALTYAPDQADSSRPEPDTALACCPCYADCPGPEADPALALTEGREWPAEGSVPELDPALADSSGDAERP